jgi:diadenosine tetraphosphate (Ap4A) HIT family hydrolase
MKRGAIDLNATMKKFGAPDTLICDYHHWAVLLRPGQVTLGSLVLICKEPATAFSMISVAAFSELHSVTRDIEGVLRRTFNYDRINYLMLMMVDPDVHFHVIPRYETPQTFSAQVFTDPGWPGPPDLAKVNATDTEQNHGILTALKAHWP